jgi:hypothetical protein
MWRPAYRTHMQSREVEEGFSGGAGSARTALRAGWLKATMTVDEMKAMLIEQEPCADHCQIVANSKRPS